MGACASSLPALGATEEFDFAVGRTPSRLREAEATLATKSQEQSRALRNRYTSCDSDVSTLLSEGSTPLVLDSRGEISGTYDLQGNSKIGAGAFGFVFKAVHKTTGAVRAVKKIILTESDIEDDVWRNEVAFLKAMDHPNIIRLFETVEDSRCIYLAMELAEGGDLFDRIVALKRLGEGDGRIVMRDVLRAVQYMHSRDVAHRDLKPENFLLSGTGPIASNVLKLADFGSATVCAEGQVLRTKVGTAHYVAPQVLLRRYGRDCDLWSAGALMYVALSGTMPFPGRTDAEVLARVRHGAYSFSAPPWRSKSKAAKDLIKNLLSVSTRSRCTVEQALAHRWVKDERAIVTASFADFDIEQIESYSSDNVLKKTALQIIARQLKDAEVKRLRDLFIGLDANNDGMLTESELVAGLAQKGLEAHARSLQRLFRMLVADRQGIPYTEFIAAALEPSSYSERSLCWAAFNVFDANGDGRISLQELERVLCQGQDASARTGLKSLLRELDVDGDGSINFPEFMSMMRYGVNRGASPVPPNAAAGGA